MRVPGIQSKTRVTFAPFPSALDLRFSCSRGLRRWRITELFQAPIFLFSRSRSLARVSLGHSDVSLHFTHTHTHTHTRSSCTNADPSGRLPAPRGRPMHSKPAEQSKSHNCWPKLHILSTLGRVLAFPNRECVRHQVPFSDFTWG